MPPAGPSGYFIENAALFDGTSGYLSWTPPTGSGNTKFIFSDWVKRSDLAFGQIFGVRNTAANPGDAFKVGFNGDAIYIQNMSGASADWQHVTTALYRDPAAHMHILISIDTDDATATDRVQLWVNGAQVTSFSTSTDPALNAVQEVGQQYAHKLGVNRTDGGAYNGYFDGYQGDAVLVVGSSIQNGDYASTNFGEFNDDGIWTPKSPKALTFGTNGFWLDFADAANLGNDAASNIPYNLRAEGTNLGNMTANGGLAAGFDGNRLSDSGATAVAEVTSTAATIGKDWGAGVTRTISSASMWGEDGNDHNATSDEAMEAVLQGSADNSSWTTISDNLTWTDASTATKRSFANIVTTTAYRYHRVLMNAVDDGSVKMFIGNLELYTATEFGMVKNGTITQVQDTPSDKSANGTANYATFNPLAAGANVVLTNGNKTYTIATGEHTVGVTHPPLVTGKWYCEFDVGAKFHGGVGFYTEDFTSANFAGSLATGSGKCVRIYNSTSTNNRIYDGSSFTDYTVPTVVAGDRLVIFVDADAKEVYLGYIDASVSTTVNWRFGAAITGDPETNTNPTYTYTEDQCFMGMSASTTVDGTTILSQEADWLGTPPTGGLAMNTDNITRNQTGKLADHFATVLYAGNGAAARGITGVGFQPDFIWLKNRSAASNHRLVDSIRGIGQELVPDTTGAEFTSDASTRFDSFDTDGFTVTDGAGNAHNESGNNYVAWCASLPNTVTSGWSGSPSITPSKEVYNAELGMSIVAYSGDSTQGSIPHSLGRKVKMAIIKPRNATASWCVFHDAVCLNDTDYLQLDNTSALITPGSTRWDVSTHSTTLFGLGTDGDTNATGRNYIAYLFTSTDFLKVFKYTGNGSADGPFSNLGGTPQFVITKMSTSAGNWVIMDKTRTPYNQADGYLYTDIANAEATGHLQMDLVSNGMKIRDTNAAFNTSGATIIGVSFVSPEPDSKDGAQLRAK